MPAEATETDVALAMFGSRPTTTNSVVPRANAAAVRGRSVFGSAMAEAFQSGTGSTDHNREVSRTQENPQSPGPVPLGEPGSATPQLSVCSSCNRSLSWRRDLIWSFRKILVRWNSTVLSPMNSFVEISLLLMPDLAS